MQLKLGRQPECERARTARRSSVTGVQLRVAMAAASPLGATKLTKWLDRHRDTLGRHYTSELARRVHWDTSSPKGFRGTRPVAGVA